MPSPRKPRKSASVAERAKESEARGARVGAARQALRDALIVQRTQEQWSWEMIATEAGISIRQCQRVANAYQALPSPLEVAPTALVEELARGYRQTVASFTALAASADNTAAAVGALKGANDAREKLLAVLQAIGHVPNDLGVLRLQRDVEQIARGMLDAVERFRGGELDADGLEAVFFELANIPAVPAGITIGGDDVEPDD
jgi:hypothetical protein